MYFVASSSNKVFGDNIVILLLVKKFVTQKCWHCLNYYQGAVHK